MKTKVWDERFKCWCCGTETTFGTVIAAALDGRSFVCLVCRTPLRVPVRKVVSEDFANPSRVSSESGRGAEMVVWSAELDESLIQRLQAAIAYAELLARGGGSGPAAVGLERIALGLA